ncbi:hypothetical protein R6Q57_026690 [Mikania cordata]
MNGPFFRNYSNQQPSRSPRSVPVQQTHQKSSPKVVSVPIHFVSSDQPRTTMFMLKDSAARKIQKVFRGFVVRKSVRKIASIRREVSEIERRIEDTESVNLIRRDEKERLRVTETLMSLLFKLDSIRGVDCGIRDLRKAVTRKAIALQEKVDSIDNQTLDSSDHDSGEIDLVSSVACTSTSDKVTEASNSLDAKVDNLESNEDDEDGSVVKEVVEEDVENSSCDIKAADVSGEVEAMEASPAVNRTESGEKDDEEEDPSTMDLRNHYENREIVEKLMDDNEKLMKVMSQISERNEMQSRMINLLSERVERLEKTLISERQRKKKKARVSLRRRGRDEDIFSLFS